MQLRFDGLDLGGDPVEFGVRQSDKLGIGLTGHLPSLVQIVLQAPQTLGGAHHRGEPGVLPAERAKLRLIARDLWIGERVGNLLRPLQRLAESGLHGLRLGGLALVLAAEAVDAAGRVHEALLAREVRVALGAHFDVNVVRRRAGLELIAAGADDGQLLVLGMQIGLHGSLLIENPEPSTAV